MKYKLSYYIILEKSFLSPEKYIAFSTRSNTFLMITDTCYKCLVSNRLDLIPEPIIQKLYYSKIIVDNETDELEEIISENKHNIENDTETLYEIIQPSAWCQLGCYYCGQKHAQEKTTNEISEKITERILYKLKLRNYKKLTIGWFGAEPLTGLPSMRKINGRLKEKCEELNISLDSVIVTNGLGLKPHIFKELVEDFNTYSFEVTLDGIGQYHDAHRYTKSSGKSFNIIYTNLKNVLNSSIFDKSKHKIVIRCNVDHANIDGIEPLIHKLAEDNLNEKITNLYFMSIYSWGKNDAHKKSLSKQEFALKKMQWDMLKVSLGFPIQFRFKQRKHNVCMAVNKDSEMYDSSGNIYNCSEVSYVDAYKDSTYVLGNILEDPEKQYDKKPFHDWNDNIKSNSKYQCHSCRLLPMCGGACPKSWTEGIPACPPFKNSIKKELQLYEIMLTKNESAFSSFKDALSIQDFNMVF